VKHRGASGSERTAAEKTVSRETSQAAPEMTVPFLRQIVSPETSRAGPKNTILQNNPIHQKIVLVFQ
jgi:hypothetical protein